MRKKWIAIVLCAVVLAGICTAVFAAGGSDDPLVSASWLFDTLMPKLQEMFSRESAEVSSLAAAYETRLSGVSFPGNSGIEADSGMTQLELQKDDTYKLDEFSAFLLLSGTAKLRAGVCEVVDLTAGEVCPDGAWLQPGHRYFAAEGSGATILFYSEARGALDGSGLREYDVRFPAADRFTDTEGHWAQESICRMTELNAVNGIETHTFAPDMTVSRAMFITVLYRLFETEGGRDYEPFFDDVKEGDWYAPYINWAAEKGLVLGYGGGLFGPDDPMTREQMAAVLSRCCSEFDFALPESSETEGFSDTEKISAWAKDAVELSRRAGLLNGRTTGEFDPAGCATRAEMCTVFCRLYEKTA